MSEVASPLPPPSLPALDCSGHRWTALDRSGHRRTSTGEVQIGVGTAGPQPASPDCSGHRRTSTGEVPSKDMLNGLSDYMSDRLPENMLDRMREYTYIYIICIYIYIMYLYTYGCESECKAPDPYPEPTGRSIPQIHTKTQVIQTDPYVWITAGRSIPEF